MKLLKVKKPTGVKLKESRPVASALPLPSLHYRIVVCDPRYYYFSFLSLKLFTYNSSVYFLFDFFLYYPRCSPVRSCYPPDKKDNRLALVCTHSFSISVKLRHSECVRARAPGGPHPSNRQKK